MPAYSCESGKAIGAGRNGKLKVREEWTGSDGEGRMVE